MATLDVVVPESPRELPFDLEEADTNNALAELDLSYDAHGDFALASDDLRYLMEDCAATARETTRLVAWLKQLTQAPRSLARSLKALRSSEDALRRITLAPRGLKI